MPMKISKSDKKSPKGRLKTNGKPPKDNSPCGKDHRNAGKVWGKPFKKGQSGNPKGMPPKWPRIAELTKVHTENAVAVLAEIMMDPENKAGERIAAAESLLSRTYGKPRATVDLNSTYDVTQDFLQALKEVNRKGQRALAKEQNKAPPVIIEDAEVVTEKS